MEVTTSGRRAPPVAGELRTGLFPTNKLQHPLREMQSSSDAFTFFKSESLIDTVNIF